MAQAMGERVNQARSTIQYLKNTIEQVRVPSPVMPANQLLHRSRTNRCPHRNFPSKKCYFCSSRIRTDFAMYDKRRPFLHVCFCLPAPTNQHRTTNKRFPATVPQVRRERALDGLMEDGSRAGGEDGTGGDGNSRRQTELDEEEDEEETKCKAAIEVEKRVYKGSFQVRTCVLRA